MKIFTYIERINRIHELVKHKRTGTPEELARRLNISPSMLFRVIEELRLMEVPIEYSRSQKTYFYSSSYSMKIIIDFKPLNEEELIGLNGGFNMASYSLNSFKC